MIEPEARVAVISVDGIPAAGKTGTTNDYNNANFAGFLPYPTAKGEPLDPENSYVLAAYSGYDVPRQMVRGAVKVSGAVGALPAWIGLAKEIIDKKKFVEMVDPLDLVRQTLSEHHYPDGFVLFCGTLFAPTQDRDVPGTGFTHKIGDRVTISSTRLGALTNTVTTSRDAPAWDVGIAAFIRNLAQRGLIDRV